MEREILMHSTPLINADGSVNAPMCCGQRMVSDGGCSVGCCDDYKCSECERRVRVEWPD